MKKEYIYQSEILDAETNEVIAKVSAFSPEGLEEEMGKSKWTEAIEKYEHLEDEDKKAMDAERLEEKKDEIVSEGELTDMFGEGGKEEVKEAMDKELEADYLADKKLEELDADTLEENL